MIDLIFETLGQTFDEENGVASGWSDVRLSQLGMDQAKQLASRYSATPPHAIFAGDLKRSQQTVTIAFDANPKLVWTDWRLRECDYGDMAGLPLAEFTMGRVQHIATPYTNGESYVQFVTRVASFLKDLKLRWDGKTVLLVGDQSTFAALEYLLKGVPLETSLQAEWSWQPGWRYQIQ